MVMCLTVKYFFKNTTLIQLKFPPIIGSNPIFTRMYS